LNKAAVIGEHVVRHHTLEWSSGTAAALAHLDIVQAPSI
jgi:hypothetical protein